MPTKPDLTVAVDPGVKRTGLAVSSPTGIVTSSWRPWAAVRYLHNCCQAEQVEQVILEQWVPYPEAMNGNAWRDLVEVKTLGAMEWLCRQYGVKFCYQATGILKPTQAYANSQGYQWKARNRDEKAAETHLYYYQQLREE